MTDDRRPDRDNPAQSTQVEEGIGAELAATVREALEALEARDPARRAFGAARHGYALAPPLTAADIDAIEQEIGTMLPEELRAFALAVGGGGAGPGYGWISPVRAARRLVTPPGTPTSVMEVPWRRPSTPELPWRRAITVAHLGCAYAAIVPLDGAARGEVWIDARALKKIAPMHPSFAAFYLEWIGRLARAAWPESFVPAGECALPTAIGGYLDVCEQRLGVERGSLAGAALREALGALGPGSIAIAADGAPALFDDGDRVDPCIACARLLESLAADGLGPDVVAPGILPAPER